MFLFPSTQYTFCLHWFVVTQHFCLTAQSHRMCLSLVLEPIGALVVDADHLTIFSFVLPFLQLHHTVSWRHWCDLGRKEFLCVRNCSSFRALRTEPASCPSSDKAAPTEPTTSAPLLKLCLMSKSSVASTCVANRASCACVLRLGSQRHACDHRRRKVG